MISEIEKHNFYQGKEVSGSSKKKKIKSKKVVKFILYKSTP